MKHLRKQQSGPQSFAQFQDYRSEELWASFPASVLDWDQLAMEAHAREYHEKGVILHLKRLPH